MTQSEIEMAKLEKDKDIARQHEDREDRRARNKNIANLVTGLSKNIPLKLLNSPDWYKQYDGLEGVNTNIPDFTVADDQDDHLSSSTADANSSVYAVRYYQLIGQGSSLTGSSLLTNPFNSGNKGEINTAISRIRANLGKRNSLAFTIGKDTFGRYMIAAIDGLYGPMKRLKTALDVYTVANAFYPMLSQKLITALGFNYHDFDSNIANYRDMYCKWANKINESIPVIKSFTFLERRLFLLGLILKDRNDARCQNVVFSPLNDAYMRSSDDLVHYRPVYGTEVYHCDEFFSMIEETFSVLTDGATWKTVIRLFLNGFDRKDFYLLPCSPDSVTTGWGFSEEMLNQLHNIKTLPYSRASNTGYDGANLYQGIAIGDSLTIGGDSAENIIQGIAASGKTIPTAFSNLIPKYGLVVTYRGAQTMMDAYPLLSTFPHVEGADQTIVYNEFKKPSADSYLVGTRLTAICGARSTGSTPISIPSTDPLPFDGFNGYLATNTYYACIFPLLFGTEIVSHIECILSSDVATSSSSVTWNSSALMWNDAYPTGGKEDFEWHTSVAMTNGTQAQQLMMLDAKFSVIDWLPLYKRYVIVGGVKTYATYGELSHYTTIPFDNIFKLHGQAILSEFSIKANLFLPPLK